MRTTFLLCLLLICGSPSFAASEEEVGRFGAKMEGAFKCTIYAADSHDLKEQQRLFQIGPKGGSRLCGGDEKPQRFPNG
jgi:hypothetical protein